MELIPFRVQQEIKMKNQQTKTPIDLLGEVYETMYERAVENFHKAEELSAPVLHKFIDEAKDEAVKLEKVGQDDAEKLAEWLKQDVHEAVEYLAKNEPKVQHFLGFELGALKSVALDKLLVTADEAKLQLLVLKGEIKHRLHPRTGEVIGAGTLVCDECGEKLHFHKAGKIPPCPKCHGTSFHRGYIS